MNDSLLCESEGLPPHGYVGDIGSRKAAEKYAFRFHGKDANRVLRVNVTDRKTGQVKAFEVQVMANRCIASGDD